MRTMHYGPMPLSASMVVDKPSSYGPISVTVVA
jgi:hypothetical protein